ncbi:MAG: hypothetical protein RJQ14_08100, partial [Marinoscillum sp.]
MFFRISSACWTKEANRAGSFMLQHAYLFLLSIQKWIDDDFIQIPCNIYFGIISKEIASCSALTQYLDLSSELLRIDRNSSALGYNKA